VNIPGYNKEEIEISCKNEVLTISADRAGQKEDRSEGYIRKERYFGKRERSFSLKGLDQESIKANLADGVLMIDIRKDEKYIEEKKVEIE